MTPKKRKKFEDQKLLIVALFQLIFLTFMRRHFAVSGVNDP